ncbi:TIM-barrel domain-containing protein [Parabacteroides sp. FAFU027]|uniref:glycoside hydrolase family 31 protein n=1 Tax=Parabacteroides sp. FAFU027 TaxID=2922715 RepID=UPI001FAFDB6C|nr:TIM-barrel domain-containing protein [Parabacteroides sp. FAFU027]
MKRKSVIVALLGTILVIPVSAQNYQKTAQGIKTRLQSMDVEVQFYSPSIVRVLKAPEGFVYRKESLSVVKKPQDTRFTTTQQGDVVAMKSDKLEVDVNLKTGRVSYLDLKGNPLLTEKDYGTQFTPTVDVQKNTYTARQAFLLDKDEPIYGLGQQQNNRLNQRGQQNVLKNGNTRVCIPFFQSIKGYGIFWDNYASTLFTDNLQETSFESLADCSDYYFMYGGSGDGVVAQMRDLTGQVPMLPLWTYGYWQSKERYKTQDELVGIVEKYRNLKVPLDGIVQDWQYWGRDSVWNAMSFDKKTYPDPKAMVEKIHNLKAHLMIVSWPGFGPLTTQYKEFEQKKMLIDFDTWPPNSGTKPYDPYNPEARDIYWSYLNKGVFSYGTDAWWLDSSEPDHINVKEKDFDQPTYLGTYRSVVNAFPLEHVKGVYEHQRATTSDKRVCILTRSAFAGQQRYGANTWSGDIGASWETLQKQIPAALNFSLSGNPYWNADIGGFFLWNYQGSNALKNNAYRELYLRWIQFGAFTPMMRSHGTDAPREIFNFGKHGDRDFDAIEKYINLRYSLLPYLYSTAWGVSNRSETIMRALFMDFANDKKVYDMTGEYMFGRSILVAPVTEPMYVSKQDGKGVEDYSQVKSKTVYLPKGAEWFDFWTGEKLTGGQEVSKAAPIDIMPLYMKAGSILPWGPKVQYAQEKKWDNLEIRVYPGADGEFTLYEDETDNYNYEKGAYSTITFKWNDQSKTLSINDRKGKFKGMMTSRKFNIVMVGKANGCGDVPGKAGKTVAYNGKSLNVKF